VFFRLFRIDVKRRNLKRNENESKRKQHKKEAETAIIFAPKRNEVKQKKKFFCFDAKKVFFLHLKRNENEMKRKQNEKEAKKDKVKIWDNL
jgi:hypothetical protein